MWIKEYRNSRDIDIEFEDGYIAQNKDIRHFRKGVIESPLARTMFGIGYIGIGSYKAKKHMEIYSKWRGMFIRCYDEKYTLKHPTYKDCSVCEEWCNFQNFAKWYEDNYYVTNNEIMDLDKDILIKNNKIYSSSKCVFVPQTINKLFTKRQNQRGKYPIGVCKATKGNKFETWCNINKEQRYIGVFNTIQEAFLKYKEVKEKEIKRIAEEYKNKIPNKLYKALCDYRVEITD